jgi:hypothetical protein
VSVVETVTDWITPLVSFSVLPTKRFSSDLIAKESASIARVFLPSLATALLYAGAETLAGYDL